MKKSFWTKEPLRWFLLLWVTMAAISSLLSTYTPEGLALAGSAWQSVNIGLYLAVPSHPSADFMNSFPLARAESIAPMTSPVSALIFLLLAALYGFLLWQGLAGRVQARLFWPYFLFQGLLVFAMLWVERRPSLDFYLALTLCAVVLFKRAAPVLLIGAGYLLLFFLSLSIHLPYGVTLGTHLLFLWLGLWKFSDLTTIVLFVLGYLLLYAQQSNAQRALEQAHSRLAASSRQIETLTLLTERQRIARELHDTLAQGIAGMIMQLEVASAHIHRQNYQQARQVLDQALSCARATLQHARHAITDLRQKTPSADQLVESVREEIAHFLQTTGNQCHTHLDDLVYTPAHACEHALRIISEGLSNVARHAQARQVSVEARAVDGWLSIIVRDDGRGFDPDNQTLYTGHYGLVGLRERANLVEGTFSVNSSPGKGTTLEFRLPLVPLSDKFAPLPHQQAYPSSANSGEATYA